MVGRFIAWMQILMNWSGCDWQQRKARSILFLLILIFWRRCNPRHDIFWIAISSALRSVSECSIATGTSPKNGTNFVCMHAWMNFVLLDVDGWAVERTKLSKCVVFRRKLSCKTVNARRRFDKALATLFCLAGGLVPWSDVLPDLYRCSRMAICVFTVFTLVSVNLAVCIIIRSDYILFSISPLRHFDEVLSALHKFHSFF